MWQSCMHCLHAEWRKDRNSVVWELEAVVDELQHLHVGVQTEHTRSLIEKWSYINAGMNQHIYMFTCLACRILWCQGYMKWWIQSEPRSQNPCMTALRDPFQVHCFCPLPELTFKLERLYLAYMQLCKMSCLTVTRFLSMYSSWWISSC